MGIRRLLAERLRDSDVLTRYGGEEFLIIATHTQAQPACELADEAAHAEERPDEHAHAGTDQCIGGPGDEGVHLGGVATWLL